MHCFRERKAAFSVNGYAYYEKRILKSGEIVWQMQCWEKMHSWSIYSNGQKSLFPNLHVFVEILKQFQTESHIKMASADQLKVNYSKADVQRWKNLDDMIKKNM